MKKIFIGRKHCCDLDYIYPLLKFHLSFYGELVTDVSEADYIVFPATCVGTFDTLKFVMEDMLSIISKKKEGALTFVTGCMTRNIINQELSKEIQRFFDEKVDYVFPEDNYQEIVNIIAGRRVIDSNFGACYSMGDLAKFYISRGCNNRCSFCKMQYQDLPTKSVVLDEIKFQVEELPKSIKRVNIYGTNISQYGVDKNYQYNLCDVLDLFEESSQVENVNLYGFAFRDAIRNDFGNVLKYNSKIGKIKGSIETGSPRLLSMMNKGYTIPELIQFWDNMQSIYPRALETDVIVGFPTETYDDILSTLELIERLNPEYVQLHMYQNSFMIPSSQYEQLSNTEIKEHYKIYKKELSGRVA